MTTFLIILGALALLFAGFVCGLVYFIYCLGQLFRPNQ